MTAQEIKGFAHRVAADNAFKGKNTIVLLWADPKGNGKKVYLGHGRGAGTTVRAKARRFFYDDDKVSESLQTLALQGMFLQVDAVKKGELFEDPNAD
jgi:hypothetical protein